MNENIILKMLLAVPLLADRSLRQLLLPLRGNERETWNAFAKKTISWLALSSLFSLAGWTAAYADSGYNVVQMSTAAPAGTETSFLSAVQNQFIAGVTANPLASNTYSIKLYGPNPAYTAPAPPPTTLDQALSLGATVYLYGYRDGAGYEEHTDADIVNSFAVNCSTPISGVPTFDIPTCQAVAGAIDEAIFQQYNSTVPVVQGF